MLACKGGDPPGGRRRDAGHLARRPVGGTRRGIRPSTPVASSRFGCRRRSGSGTCTRPSCRWRRTGAVHVAPGLPRSTTQRRGVAATGGARERRADAAGGRAWRNGVLESIDSCWRAASAPSCAKVSVPRQLRPCRPRVDLGRPRSPALARRNERR
eukprot:358031-Chlamydomonas_euryale.AAC.4